MRGFEVRVRFLEFPKNIPGSDGTVLQIGPRLTLEGKGFLKVKSDDDAPREFQKK